MKKILATVALTAFAASVFAQSGTVGFSNGTGLVKKWTSATDQTAVNVGFQGGFVQLFYAAAGTAYTPWTASMTPANWYAANPGWSLAGTPTVVGPLNNPVMFGKFNGGQLTLTGITAGANIDYVVVGWTGSAASFDAAYTAAGEMLGVSGKFTSGTGNAGSPPSPATPLSTTFAGVTLSPVPEPSTFALAGLGAAALLIFRRRS